MSTAVTENPQLGAAFTMYSDIMSQLNALDEALDSTVDAKSAGKRALRNKLVVQYEGDWKPSVDSLVTSLSEFPVEQRVAVFSAFISQLNKAFDAEAQKYLEDQVESNKTDTSEAPTFTDEQIKKLSEDRSALYKAAKNTRELAILFGGTEEQFPLPKKRTGTRGKRGKRAISMYDWSINGEALKDDENSLLWVANKYGYENVAALRKAIQESLTDAEGKPLKDLKDPPSPITFALPGGFILVGVRDLSEPTTDSESDSDEDDEDDGEEDDAE